MASRDELIKYVTKQLVVYMETPRQERKRQRQAAKAARQPWLTHWFGIAPLGIAIWWRGRKEKKKVKRKQQF
ncbi:YqzE family protein [Paenibacillus sp. GCM10027626]|uniref:YqzE family protein n=1 Tax=Paenibacillus sp. GCM10027626 TaxID=3273411 RepID=UPI00362B3BDB